MASWKLQGQTPMVTECDHCGKRTNSQIEDGVFYSAKDWYLTQGSLTVSKIDKDGYAVKINLQEKEFCSIRCLMNYIRSGGKPRLNLEE